jgi:hypothetical protein
MSPFLFHYYDGYNALTQSERQVYRLDLLNVQGKLAQGKTLDPNAPELDHINQSEIPFQPVDQGYTIGTQRQARTGYAREGSSQGGLRLSMPEHRSLSPMAHVQPNRSPAAQRDSSRTMESDAEDGCAPPYSVHGWPFKPIRLQTARISIREDGSIARVV